MTRGEERGGVPIEFALGVGVLLLPVAILVLTFPTWVERQSLARLAAQEAARTVVLAHDYTAGVAAGAELAQQVAVNHGLAADELQVAFTGSLQRGATVTAIVTVRIPAAAFPGIGSVGAMSWTTSHTEHVDRYRSFE